MQRFNTIKEHVTAQIIEKKSKFIANIFYVETVEEAEEYIKQIKKKYNDARHNCFAYAIETGDGGIAVKYNDDGEPRRNSRQPNIKTNIRKRVIKHISYSNKILWRNTIRNRRTSKKLFRSHRRSIKKSPNNTKRKRIRGKNTNRI